MRRKVKGSETRRMARRKCRAVSQAIRRSESRRGASALPEGGGVDWDALAADYDLVRDRIERVVPGFEA